jgi:hypothetical protein
MQSFYCLQQIRFCNYTVAPWSRSMWAHSRRQPDRRSEENNLFVETNMHTGGHVLWSMSLSHALCPRRCLMSIIDLISSETRTTSVTSRSVGHSCTKKQSCEFIRWSAAVAVVWCSIHRRPYRWMGRASLTLSGADFVGRLVP